MRPNAAVKDHGPILTPILFDNVVFPLFDPSAEGQGEGILPFVVSLSNHR